MRKILSLLALVGCASEQPETSTTESKLVAVSVGAQGPSPAQFEKMHARDDDDEVTAQLNFELRIVNTGTQTTVLDRADLSYTGAAALAPQVSRTDLRKFYLDKCDRDGFGLDLSGSLSLDLAGFTSEEIGDIDTPSSNAYLAATGFRKQNMGNLGLVDVSAFIVGKLESGNSLAWQTVVPWFGFQDRATAMTLAHDDASYVVVGSTHPAGIPDDPYNQPWKFAAVRVDTDGKIVKRPNSTLWQRAIPFAGCSAEAVDVVRVPLTAQTFGYVIAGTAKCAGDGRIAAAMLDQDGNLVPGFGVGGTVVIDPGALPAKVGAVAFDPIGNHIYVVGGLGDDVMIAKLDMSGALVPGYGVAGIKAWDGASHDKMMGTDAKVMSDRRLAIATSSRRTPANQFHMGMLRLTFTGANDPALPGGFIAVNVPGMENSYGQAIEIHEGETWFTVSGFADNGTKRRMVAAAFAANGSLKTEFDSDGFLVAGPVGPAPAYRSSINGDYITIGGSNGSVLGGTRFKRKDGTPDDPSVLGVGEECAFLWPDTGVLPAGATHAMNAWQWGSLPTGAAVDLRFTPYPSGGATVKSWSTPIDAPSAGFPFPGRQPDQANTYWKINYGHAIMDDHRRAHMYRSLVDAYVNKQRYAYDIGMVRWDGTSWTSFVADDNGETTKGKQNKEYEVWGEPVHPIADGWITHCSSGVQENTTPGVKDIGQMCNDTGIPCYYAIGGNSFRIQHDDGSTSYYAHLQNSLDPELCPFTNAGGAVPLLQRKHVTTGTTLGVVGNSGNSDGPHLHLEYSVAWDATDVNKDPYDYADGRPLLFDNVHGVRVTDTLTPAQLPDPEGPYPVAAQWGGTLLVMEPPPPPPPNDGTTCFTTDVSSPDLEERQADGNAGPNLYCPGENSVCITNGDGGSDCQDCTLGHYAGCPCNDDAQCGAGDLICWGAADAFSHARDYTPSGLCYSYSGIPVWSCGYDCRANFGTGAWCYNDFASLSGRARCMDSLTEIGTLEMCWEDGYEQSCTSEPDGESCVEECMCSNGYSWASSSDLSACESECQPSTMPALDDECAVECLTDADCQALNYPNEYHCDNGVGVPVCRIPL